MKVLTLTLCSLIATSQKRVVSSLVDPDGCYFSTAIHPGIYNISVFSRNGQPVGDFIHSSPTISGFVQGDEIFKTCVERQYLQEKEWYFVVEMVVLGLFSLSFFWCILLQFLRHRVRSTVIQDVVDNDLMQAASENEIDKGDLIKLKNYVKMTPYDKWKQQNQQQSQQKNWLQRQMIRLSLNYNSQFRVLVVGLIIACGIVFIGDIFIPQTRETVTVEYCRKIPPRCEATQLMDIQTEQILNLTSNLTHLLVQSDCGSSYFNAAQNIRYQVQPVYTLNCETVTASILTEIATGYVIYCQAQSAPVVNLSKFMGSHNQTLENGVPIGQCFFQKRYTVSWMAWNGQDNAPNWQFCSATPNQLNLTRINLTTMEKTVLSPTQIQGTNPYKQWIDGFFINGTDMIGLTPGNVNKLGGNIGFNTTVKQMAMSHWLSAGQQRPPSVSPVQTTVFFPMPTSCKVLMIFPSQNWTELNQWCQNAVVQNDTGNIVFLAMDQGSCNIRAQDQKGRIVNVVVGQNGKLVQKAQFFYYWDVLNGISGQPQFYPINQSLITFNPAGQTMVSVQQSNSTYPNSHTNIHPFSRMQSIMIIVGSCLVGLFVLVLMIWVIYRCCLCRMKSQAEKKSQEIKEQLVSESKETTQLQPMPKQVPTARGYEDIF